MQTLRQKTFIILLAILITIQASPSRDLAAKLNQIVNDRELRGLQLQITQNGTPIFSHNTGTKNSDNQPINSDTMFMVASLSKSVSGVAIMQLVERGLLKLNDTLSSILGFDIKNPYYPGLPITVEMTLCHETSIAQPFTEYMNFMAATQNNTDGGASIPSLRQILLPDGKYYNPSIFSSNRKPGQYFSYSNLGYVIAGTIVQTISRTRFDLYVKQNILDFVSQGQPQNATFNPATIQNYNNLGWIFMGQNGSWVPNRDNYTSPIFQKNLTFYQIGTNAGIYNPSAQMRASIRHLNNYLYMIANNGLTKNGKRILSESSVNQLIKPRYQYHGPLYGNKNVFHMYGLGIYTTSYLNDIVIDHQVVRGHLGNSEGLISGYFYWKNYCFSYVINGALNGYGNKTTSIYQLQRVLIQSAVNDFVSQIQKEENLKKREQQTQIEGFSQLI